MGTGWVLETLDHDYADAQRRGHPVTLLVTETTGALSPTFDRALRALGKHAHARRPPMTPPAHPVSRYGLSRSSHRTFLAHHRAAISAAVVLSQTVSQLFHGPAPRSPLHRLAVRLRHSRRCVVLADATTISLAAPAMSFKLTIGMSPF